MSHKKLFFTLFLACLLMALEVQAKPRNVTGNANNDDDSDFVPRTQQPPTFYPQPRIVGGSNAIAGQFPYQVSVRVGGGHICGGSIISANYVLTAAHCVGRGTTPTPASLISIRAGSALVDSSRFDFSQTANVSSVIIHPSYTNFNNDIALLKLSNRLLFTPCVKAIDLAAYTPPPNAKVLTSGWGLLRSGGDAPQILQYTTLTVLSNAQCSQILGRVPNTVLCLGHTSGNGVCQGDSGGPAVYRNELVGVASFVVGDCGSTYPDGYANVATFRDWIKNNSDV